MFRSKTGNTSNSITKRCDVLLYRLSASDISCMQKNPTLISSQDLPYRRPGKECSVLLRRSKLKAKDVSALNSSRKATASYLPQETPYVLLDKPKKYRTDSSSSLQAARKTKRVKRKLQIHYSVHMYTELFKEYLDELQQNRTEMEEKLSKRNINKELFILHRFDGRTTKTLNKDLVLALLEKYQKVMVNSEIHMNESICVLAAENAIEQKNAGVLEEDEEIVSSSDILEGEDFSPLNAEMLDVCSLLIDLPPENVCDEQFRFKFEEKLGTIQPTEYSPPPILKEMSKAAILMVDCPCYLNKLTETNANGNQMGPQLAHFSASQNKERNESVDLRENKNKNINQIRISEEKEILAWYESVTKFPQSFLNEFLSESNHFFYNNQ